MCSYIMNSKLLITFKALEIIFESSVIMGFFFSRHDNLNIPYTFILKLISSLIHFCSIIK